MKKTIFHLLFIGWMAAFLSVSFHVSGQAQSSLDNLKLPPHWILKKTISVSPGRLVEFSARLGGQLVSARNYYIEVQGFELQLNIAECLTEEDAQKVYQVFRSIHKTDDECLLQGKTVYEFISNHSQLVKLAKRLCCGEDIDGLDMEDRIVWDVVLLVAPLKKVDDMRLAEFFNLLIRFDADPTDNDVLPKIEQVSKRFMFSDLISLRYETPSWGAPRYVIPDAEKVTEEGDIVFYRLKNPRYRLGIPQLEIRAKIPVRSSLPYQPQDEIDQQRLTSPTPRWPTHDPRIVDLTGALIKGEIGQEQKLKIIQSWVRSNIKYGGKVMASRYGVPQVLKKGFGRCWDLCDVFVTLCRAAGIPARQVMGWIYGKDGHVWAEVYLQGKGWISLDPAGSFQGTSTDYIPFFISEEGEMPAVYWKKPVIIGPAR